MGPRDFNSPSLQSGSVLLPGTGQSVLQASVEGNLEKPLRLQRRNAFIVGLILVSLSIVMSALLIAFDFSTSAEFRAAAPPLTSSQARTKEYVCYALAGFNCLVVVFLLCAYRLRTRDATFRSRNIIPLPAFIVMSMSFPLLLAHDGFLVSYGKTYPGPYLFLLFSNPVLWFARAMGVLPLSALMLRLVLIYYCPNKIWVKKVSLRSNLNYIMYMYIFLGAIPFMVLFIIHTVIIMNSPTRYQFVGLVWLRGAHTAWHLFLFGCDGVLAFCLLAVRRQLKRHDLYVSMALIVMATLWWVSAGLGVSRLYTRLALYSFPQYAYTATLCAQSVSLILAWALGALRRRRLPGSELVVSNGPVILGAVGSRSVMFGFDHNNRPSSSDSPPQKGGGP